MAAQTAPEPDKIGIVRFGDTLIKLAKRYNLTIGELLRLNPGLEAARLVAGTQVRLTRSAPGRARMVLGLNPVGSGGLSRPDLPSFGVTGKDVEISKCKEPPVIYVMEDAINLKTSALTTLKRLRQSSEHAHCGDSQVRLFCFAGRCAVLFDKGQHGYHPTSCSKVRIGQRVWSWCGDQPWEIAASMWPHLVDGVEVATQLALWPRETTNTRETPVLVNQSKIKTYNASLMQGKP